MSQLLKFKKIKRETQEKHKKPEEKTKKNKEKYGEIGLTINMAYGVCLRGILN